MNTFQRIARVAGPMPDSGPYARLMERLERAAERGPQWIECEECDGPVRCDDIRRRCEECHGSGGYMTDPALALKRMRALTLPILDLPVTRKPDGSAQVSA